VELVREFATLVMLAAAACAAARTISSWLGGFMICFGVWDIVYYVFLKALSDWPESFLAWDLLFLLPVPWAGPVLAPLLVAIVMTFFGTVFLYKEHAGRPVLLRRTDATLMVVGAVVTVVSFCWDHGNLLDGGNPQPFAWSLFAFGLAISIGAFLRALFPMT